MYTIHRSSFLKIFMIFMPHVYHIIYFNPSYDDLVYKYTLIVCIFEEH